MAIVDKIHIKLQVWVSTIKHDDAQMYDNV